jgi:CRISPR/Cas system-associated exonuclease Cas4 (RecB family)
LGWIRQGRIPSFKLGGIWYIAFSDEEAKDIAERYGIRWEDMERASCRLEEFGKEKLEKLKELLEMGKLPVSEAAREEMLRELPKVEELKRREEEIARQEEVVRVLLLPFSSLLLDREFRKKLLFYEKDKRGVSHDRLIFAGIADIANFNWCGWKSILKNREMEMRFFEVYLEDTLKYGLKLGYITIKDLAALGEEVRVVSRKRNVDKLITGSFEVGKKIMDVVDSVSLTLEDMEKLLSEKEKKIEEWKKSEVRVEMTEVVVIKDPETGELIDIPGREVVNPLTGEEEILINPFVMPQSEIEKIKKLVEKAGKKVGRLEDYPLLEGEWAHLVREETTGEIYPTIRWNFKWHDYVIIGVPDGITKDFIYEYKRSTLSPYQLVVASTQADLYGYFFKRKRKRVQVYVKQHNYLKTYDEPVDEERALDALTKFEKVEKGEMPPPKPAEWKCRKCEYRTSCPYFI